MKKVWVTQYASAWRWGGGKYVHSWANLREYASKAGARRGLKRVQKRNRVQGYRIACVAKTW